MSSETKSTVMKEEARPALMPKLRFPKFREAEGWKVRTIGDLKPFVTSGSRGWASLYAEQGELFVRITNLSRDFIYLNLTDSKFVRLPPNTNEGVRTELKEHDVLISITADIGIIGFVDEHVPSPAYINQHIALVRFDEEEVNGKYVAFFLASENSQRLFRASTDTGTKAGMSLIGIQKFQLILPSLSDQQKVAECLSSVDELMAAQARKVDALKAHKKGLMQQLFPREGETQPRLRFPEFQYAGEWEVSELGSISDVRDGTHDSPSFLQMGRPLVTSKNLRPDGTLDLENVSLISEEDYEQINKRSKVSFGDILLGMIGTIGNPVLFKAEGFAIKNVALIKEVAPLSNAFLVQLLQSEYVASIFAVLHTGNSQKFIALGKIRGLPVPFPSLLEQQRIATCLRSLDALITAETQKLEAFKTHKKGLMQQLFPSPEAVET